MEFLESEYDNTIGKYIMNSFAMPFTHQTQCCTHRYSAKLLNNNNFQNPRAGPNDDSAHPPITPCKAVDPQTIADRNQREIYVLIVKHYLACCSRDAIGKETVLTVKMASEEFTAKGLMILERNWLEIYSPWERWSTGQGELPALQVGSRITPNTLLMKDGRTTSPSPISGELNNVVIRCESYLRTRNI
jgi:DNA topoisomerase-3